MSAAGIFPTLMHEMTHNVHLVSISITKEAVNLKGAKKREEHRRDTATTLQLSLFNSRSPTSTASTSVTPTPPPEPMVTSIGEPLQSDYQIHELPPVAHLNYWGETSLSEKARFC